MTYKELIDNIRDLGFSDDSEIDEFEEDVDVIANAINRAITEISIEYAPIIGKYEVPVPPTEAVEENGILKEVVPDMFEVDMQAVTDDKFIGFADTPVKKELKSGIYTKFSDFEIESDDTIILHTSDYENLVIFYKEMPDKYVWGENNDVRLPLPLHAHHLVPLLASYYVWLDDDLTKAQLYYERYSVAVQNALAGKDKPRARILTGWGEI